MTSRTYVRLSIEDFGAQLLESGDLDPVYIALHRCEWPEDKLGRWLIAYWCLYHVGAASHISEHEGRDFWLKLRDAGENEVKPPVGVRWPRGGERRHWRGDNARKAVRDLMGQYLHKPEEMITRITSRSVDAAHAGDPLDTLPFKLVSDRVQSHASFGPWMAFKIADMIDRLGIAPVSFDNAAVFMFDDPRKAALMLARQKAGLPEMVKFKDETATINQVVAYLEDHFKGFTAPPTHDRAVGLQEVETILCKWKSHMNGHYPLNHDITEIRMGAHQWTKVSQTCEEFLHHLPRSNNAQAATSG